jgi:senataxin
MHPDISRLPSNAFYQGRIEDGPNMEQLTTRPWHSSDIFGIYKFFNINGNEEPGESNSLRNKAEAQTAKALYARLSHQYNHVDFEKRVGIISMYRAQVNELRYQFRTAFGAKILEDVDFGTVDGFQGQEKDIIILSCVRAGPGVERIGFLAGALIPWCFS